MIRRTHQPVSQPGRHRLRSRLRSRAVAIVAVVAAVFAGLGAATQSASAEDAGVNATFLGLFEVQALDGSGNNPFFPNWGRAGTNYSRVAAARYADGKSVPVSGPNTRRVSNRAFNDVHQNLFSENGVTQWGFTWGQFIDHTIGLRLGRTEGDPVGEPRPIPFDSADPLEEFTNDLGVIPFERSAPAPGTGTSPSNPRQQVNIVGSYIDASAVFGDTTARLDWLREGAVDGNPANNSARLLLPGGFLPRADERGNAASAPRMEVDGRLLSHPDDAMVAGDVRANENIALTATHTLFAREHNRIVSRLPGFLSAEDRFQIARRVVVAQQQYITYNEFLPALGVQLAAYRGYNPFINANLGNEFATVGYRAHSMIHGEIEMETEVARYTPEQLEAFEAAGIELAVDGAEVEIAVPLNVAFFNPDLVPALQLGPLLQGIGLESQYKNDEQIDNQLRSVLFQVPVPGNPECLDGPGLPDCFDGVVDLGAIDIERGRDHGMPSYNQLRAAFGLPQKSSFTAITGETTDAFPSDPLLTPGNEVNDPNSLDFVALFDINGTPIPLGSEDAECCAVTGIRRTTLAARLKATHGTVGQLDAFTGMLAEKHVPGTEFGELQLAIWKRQFTALRDGDRFFYAADPALPFIRSVLGVDYRVTLAQVIARNTDIPANELAANVFKPAA